MDGSRCCLSGAALYAYRSSVLIRWCNVSNNRVYSGAIYGYQSTFVIEQSVFGNNRYSYYGCCSATYGGAIYLSGGNLNILNSNFSDNSVAIYRGASAGGAIYFDGNNITITNSSFINNTADSGGGGVIYSARCYTNTTLVNNIFFNNTAAYCGVMEIAEFYHDNVNITGNTFVYNRAIRQISGNDGGGVICIRNASILLLDNTFSHNSAAGDAGVIQADESDVIIERSIFSNNTAGENGGVLHTYFYPTSYTIINSLFTNNRAGGDGGVMYVGRAGSHVTISQSTFSFNNATERGGVIAIIGSNLEINSGSIFENDAAMGEMISACNSIVTIYNVGFHTVQDPTYSFCSLYNQGTTSMIPGIENITTTEDVTTAAPMTEEITTTEYTTTTAPATTKTASTAAEDITTTATTEEITTTEGITTTEAVTTSEDVTTAPTEDSTIMSTKIAPETTTRDSITVAKATPPQIIAMTTGQIDDRDRDNQQDRAQNSLHTVVPGYVAIGAFVVLLVLVVVILVKVFKVKQPVTPLKPPKVNRLNFNAYEYPTMKNELTLPEVASC